MEPTEEGTAILAAPSADGNGNEPLRRLSLDDFVARSAAPVDTQEVVIEGVGTVLVRGFTKAEQRWMRDQARREDGTTDDTKLELLMFHKGMADPVLTLEEAQQAFEQWNAPAINQILDAVIRASGLAAEFVRKAVESFRPEP